MNKVYSDLLAYIVSANDYFTGGSIQEYQRRFDYYTKDFVREFNEIKNDPKYKDNELIKSLSIVNPGDRYPIAAIRFRNVGGLSSSQKMAISEAWADLLYKGEDGIKLANDLFLYNYYKNGFSFGPETFMHLAPVMLKVNIPQYKNSLEDILNSSDNARLKYDHFIDQFLLNRTNIRELVPNIDQETSFDFTDKYGVPVDSFNLPMPQRNREWAAKAPAGDK